MKALALGAVLAVALIVGTFLATFYDGVAAAFASIGDD